MSRFAWRKQRPASAAASLGVVAALASAAAFTPPLALRHRNALRGSVQCPVLGEYLLPPAIPAAAVPVSTPVLRAKKSAIAHAHERALPSFSRPRAGRARARPVRGQCRGRCARLFLK